jgi:hypothetical protein
MHLNIHTISTNFLDQPTASTNHRSNVLSDALATAELTERVAAYVPLSVRPDCARALPLLLRPHGWAGSPYYTGALLATAIDSATLPLRLTGEFTSIAQSHQRITANLHPFSIQPNQPNPLNKPSNHCRQARPPP